MGTQNGLQYIEKIIREKEDDRWLWSGHPLK